MTTLAGSLSACTPLPGEDGVFDPDGDGSNWPEDCRSDLAGVRPGAAEIAYNGLDDDCDTATRDDDLDFDGYPRSEDCDDGLTAANPSASDATQDGIDQNCDGVDGTDADGDGIASTQTGGEDCEDEDPSVSPAQPESPYNGRDDDCEPETPDDDLDGDGHARADDCDDARPDVWSTGPEEPYDGLDNDCDLSTPDDDLDGDGFGVAEDCEDEAAAIYPGAAEVCGDGVVNDCGMERADALGACGLGGTRSLSSADASYLGVNDYGYAGSSLSMGGDATGDGRADLLIGAQMQGDSGAVYLVSEPGSGQQSLADAIGFSGTSLDAQVGTGAAIVRDTNGDGYDELLVGDSGSNRGGSQAGVAFLVLGRDPGAAWPSSLDDADACWWGSTSVDAAGSAVSGAGDFNGDGRGDLLVGAPRAGSNEQGAAYIIWDGSLGCTSLGSAQIVLVGEEGLASAGVAAAGVGDANGDGLDDIVVGAHTQGGSNSGAAYLVLGGTTTGQFALADADLVLDGDVSWAGVGVSVSAGDATGDGVPDLLIGAYEENSGGAAYQVSSDLTGRMALSDAFTAKLNAASTSDYLGRSVANAGDVDLDGREDWLVGAYGNDTNGDSAGAAYLVLGGSSGTLEAGRDTQATFPGEGASHFAGIAVSGGSDVSGDGVPDLLIAAYGYRDFHGAAYLIHGGGF